MCEKGRIRKVPPSAGIVGHGIDGTRNVAMAGEVVMRPLVQSIEPQEVGTSGKGSGRTFRSPGHRRTVVTV